MTDLNAVGRCDRMVFMSGSASTAVPALSAELPHAIPAAHTLDYVDDDDARDGVAQLLQLWRRAQYGTSAHTVTEKLTVS